MIITQTPLRISFFGGGTDFPDFYRQHGGAVLSTGIDKYVYCIVKKRFDDLIYINYSKKEIVENIDQIEHDLCREAMRLTGVEKGIEISFLSDIPSTGSGLGSSSSVLVGLLNALYQYTGKMCDAKKLAEDAVLIEIGILKKPIGVQDQYIAAYGGINFFSFDAKGILVSPIELAEKTRIELNEMLMLFYTGQTRESSAVLTEQKAKIQDNTSNLIAIKGHAYLARELFKKGQMKKLGGLLDQSWQLKKQLSSNISNNDIDEMYKKAIQAGAYGGKIAGAGNGGFLLLLVDPGKKNKVRKALSGHRYTPISLAADGSKVIFNIRQ